MQFDDWLIRAKTAQRAAHVVLATHEQSASRVILLEDLVKKLSVAPVDVQDYFREATTCLEQGLYRSGVVLAWAGHFHVFSETLFLKHEAEIRSARPKWMFKDLPDLKEQVAEAHLLDVGKEVKFIGKAVLRVLQGQLSVRNQCAHPTLYRPSMNSAIGYVDEMVRQTLGYIQP
ncbi:hypothetical protein [Methylogaea oryzae]|uniref:Uncharacterized protein n=1 Tax=Methylogaea oryzae TaxID=1295382 RepID=A0A8D4VR56_9GAMM|nr:hypothetical protein [Methylogaea oryzae]BBL72605.1 hypothetical protein MoryE10_32110 [Methylogaea oryzae]